MKTLKIYGDAVNGRFIDEAVDALRDGEIIVYPTDTLYALGCDALNNRAVEKLCRLKGIDPKRHALSVVCSDLSQAARYARIDNNAFDVMRRNLPGAFTFILPSSSSLPKVFKDRRQVGIRVPDDAVAVALAEGLGNPLITTSIEVGDVPHDVAEVVTFEIADRFADDVALMIDAGPRGIIGSTVVDLTDSSDPQIVREGLASLA